MLQPIGDNLTLYPYPLLVTSMQGISSVIYIIRPECSGADDTWSLIKQSPIVYWYTLTSIDQIGAFLKKHRNGRILFRIKSATVPLPP